MAVIHCKEVTNRSANEDAEQMLGRVRTFQLLIDTATDGMKSVLAHPALPQLYDAWQAVNALGVVTDTDARSICISREVDQNDSGDLHNCLATFRYSGLNDPTLLPADVDDDQVDYQKSLIDDLNGNPVVNKAGDPFETGLMVDRSRGLLKVTKNVLTWNAVEMEQYRDTLNDNTMFAVQFAPGFDAGTLKMRSLTAKRVPYPGNQAFYWRATAVMERNLEGWVAKIRNQGRRCLDGAGGYRIPIRKGGLTDKGEFLLAADGTELPVGGTPNVCEFDGYETVDWSAITWLEAW